MTTRRTALTVVLTAGVTMALALGAAGPASAQGNSVGGRGNHYLLSGAGNVSGRTGGAAFQLGSPEVWKSDFRFGDPGDEVYFGDFLDHFGAFEGDYEDDVVVRRGNVFFFRKLVRPIVYGDPGDTVLVGDWDGDGLDTLAVRRGNTFFVKDDWQSGVADVTFAYGDPGDDVLVGNWDGDALPDQPYAGTTDTLMVRRGNHFFVKNDLATGVADYDFVFGDPNDSVLVGDWAEPPTTGDDPATPARETTYVVRGTSADGADALAVRRGNVVHQSGELEAAEGGPGHGLGTIRSFAYGDPSDTAFVAELPYTYDANGASTWLTGDGIGLRRND